MSIKSCPSCLSEVNARVQVGSWKHCPHCGMNIVERALARDFIDDFWETIKKLEDKGYSIPQAVLFVSKMISKVCK